MPETITSLIEKLEGAEVGSDQLDGLIYLWERPSHTYIGYAAFNENKCWADFGLTRQDVVNPKSWVRGTLFRDDKGQVQAHGHPPSFTTSLDAARALASRVLPGWHVGVQPWFHTDPDRVMSRAYLIRPDWKRWNPTGDEWCDQHHGRSCHTPALAVVSALLRVQSEARV